MSTGDTFLVLSAFLASGVEFVEALTIVLAAGLARGWRSSLAGLGGGNGVLAVVRARLALLPRGARRGDGRARDRRRGARAGAHGDPDPGAPSCRRGAAARLRA